MSDTTDTNTIVSPDANVKASEDAVPASEANVEVPAPAVTSQEGALVGDENLPEPREATISVNDEPVAAQVVQPREGDADTVSVHEVVVVTDEVITDPSSPLAVQIPDAGRGDGSLPIHKLAGERPEDVFAREASSSDD